MDFNYTEEQEVIRKAMRDFARNEIAPGAEERDRSGNFPYDIYKKIGNLGFTGMRFPEKFGGTEADFLSWCLVIEEVGRVDLSLSFALAIAGESGRMLTLQVNEKQINAWKEKWILPIARGEMTMGVAITEPDAGSDTRGIKTTAVLSGNEWVINGSKEFISNVGLDTTPFAIILAATNREKGEFSYFIVPKGTPGFDMAPKEHKIGLRSLDTRGLSFEDCRVPVDNLLGREGLGREKAVRELAAGRIWVASACLGLAQTCFNLSLNQAKTRTAFKKLISKFQFIQSMLVDMALEIELARLLRDKCALLYEQGSQYFKESAMTKYFCCESAKRIADFAIQIHGALGYMDECAVSRYFRDVRGATIAEGTTEIQKYIIARELGC